MIKVKNVKLRVRFKTKNSVKSKLYKLRLKMTK